MGSKTVRRGKRESSSRHSFQVDQFRDPKVELKRLTHRAYARIEDLIPSLVALGLNPSMQILDVGAGTGVRSEVFSRYLSDGGSVLGIDTSEVLLGAAIRRKADAGLQNLEFALSDLHSPDLPFETFDFAYMRLVLQHLPQPARALQAVKRSLRPGGVLFIEETDRDWMTIFPSPKSWDVAYRRAKEIQTAKGGDPQCGRKIGRYLIEAGFENVSGKLVPVSGTGQILDDWLENYAPTYFNNLPIKKAKKGLKALDDIRESNKRTLIFFHQVWFQAFGRKPT